MHYLVTQKRENYVLKMHSEGKLCACLRVLLSEVDWLQQTGQCTNDKIWTETNLLQKYMLIIISTSSLSPSVLDYLPTKSKAKITLSWYIACPRIFFIIVLEISGFVRPYGFLSKRSGVGNSVAKAREAKVSIIKFTHNICTA